MFFDVGCVFRKDSGYATESMNDSREMVGNFVYFRDKLNACLAR